jgi:ABC-type nitrate/sulfonate/bicarbonate transport system ATPase subunit
VTKRYPDGTVAVDNLELQVRDGGITVFVGPSGCGKTTSLRMVNRMIDPTSGTILVNGTDVMKTDAAQLRRGIGYVIQQAGLFPHRTIVDNIATVPLLLGWHKKKARDRAIELMETVGLTPEMARRYPGQLSGGQQQRVGVARALAADPPVLLMDEPFSAVDPIVRESLQDELLKLQAELGKTIVFVTHDIDEGQARRPGGGVRVGGKLAQYDRRACCSPGRPTASWTPSSAATALPRPVVPLLRRLPLRAAHRPVRERTEQGWTLISTPTGAAGLAPTAPAARRRREGSRPRQLAFDTGSARCSALDAALVAVREGSRSTATGGWSAPSSRTTCWRRWPPPGAPRRPEARMGWVSGNLPLIGDLTLEHLYFALPPIVIGLVLAIPLGWLANRTRAGRTITINLSGCSTRSVPRAVRAAPAAAGHAHPDPVNVIVALTVAPSRCSSARSRTAERHPPVVVNWRPRWDTGRAGSPPSNCRCRSRSSWPAFAWPRCRTSASSRSVR